MPLAGSQKLTEELGYGVARIECETPGGVQCGTGFFFAFLLENGKRSPCLVTSRHVVEGARSGRFFLTGKPGDTRAQEFRINDLQDRCHPHPDPSVDLVLLFVGINLQALRSEGHALHVTYLSRSAILPREQRTALAALEEVAVLGFPLGLADPQQTQPVVRLGVTATHAGLPYGGAPEFLIDAPCHAGLGGAPVFLRVPALPGEGGVPQRSPGVALVGVLVAQRHASLHGGEGGVEPIVGHLRGGQAVPAAPRAGSPAPLGVVLNTDKILDFEPLVRAMVHGYVSKY
ncbi:hypothetical protein [Pseudorhodoferax sp.]|uniref:hypothetical protein n=1 Tax=Pseudorhodoferax sp. TaxID=1993553 RepID=UPI0039E5C0CA